MKIRLLLFASVVLGLCSYNAFAQSDVLMPEEEPTTIYIGPVFGFNKSMHSVDLKTHDQNICPVFSNGNANGFYGGLSFEYLMGNVKEGKSNSSIIFKALYSTLPASFEQTGDIFDSRRIGTTAADDKIITTATLWTCDVAYNVVALEALYKFRPFLGSGFGVVAGPSFDFAMTKTKTQKYKLVAPTPNNVQFTDQPKDGPIKFLRYEDNRRTIVFEDGDIANASAFRLGLLAGVQYEVPFKKLFIVPHADFNLGITNLSSDEDWRVNAFQIGVDIRFGI